MNVKYTKEVLETAVRDSICVSDVLRKLGLRMAGGTHCHIVKRLRAFEIDTSHFVGKSLARGRHRTPTKRTWQEILVLREDGRRQDAVVLRRALIESGREYVCEKCRRKPVWNNNELRFHVDHKSRNWLDDRAENLRFICPNCHSQTEGYSGSKGMTDLIDTNRGCRLRRKMKNGTVAQLVGGASLRN